MIAAQASMSRELLEIVAQDVPQRRSVIAAGRRGLRLVVTAWRGAMRALRLLELGRIEARRAVRDHRQIELARASSARSRIRLDRQAGAGQHRDERHGQRLEALLAQIAPATASRAACSAPRRRRRSADCGGRTPARSPPSASKISICVPVLRHVVLAADHVGDAEVDVVDHRGQRVEIACHRRGSAPGRTSRRC